LTAALLAFATAAAAQSPKPEIYSNVCLHEETGDQLGAEVVLWRYAGAPRVRFTLCEGGCNGASPVTEAQLTGNTLAFTVREDFVDAHGRPAGTNFQRYVATLGATALMLRLKDAPLSETDRLPRRSTAPAETRIWGICR
jgi:hypothetical protein